MVSPVLENNQCFLYISCVTIVLLLTSEYLWFINFVSLVYLKAPRNEIYEITTTLNDFDFNLNLCVVYSCMKKYMIRCEELILVKINFQYSWSFKGLQLSCIWNLTVLNGCHWQFEYFKRPSFAVSSTYTSMCAGNTFKRCKTIYALTKV